MSAKESLARIYAKAFARPSRAAQAVNHTLFHLALRGMGYNNGWKPEDSGEEWFVKNFLGPYDPHIVLDIGANVGDYSRLLLEHTNATVYAFEPLPAAYSHLKALSVKTGPRFRIVNAAVGAEHAMRPLHYAHPTSEHASLSTEVNAIPYVGAGNTKTMEVEVVALDTWILYSLTPAQRAQVDFVKIDVEGYEYEVLQGAQRFVDECKPIAIQIEWNLHQLMRGHTLRSMAALLPDYMPYQLLPRGVRPVDVGRPEANIFCYGNFIFLRKERLL